MSLNNYFWISFFFICAFVLFGEASVAVQYIRNYFFSPIFSCNEFDYHCVPYYSGFMGLEGNLNEYLFVHCVTLIYI